MSEVSIGEIQRKQILENPVPLPEISQFDPEQPMSPADRRRKFDLHKKENSGELNKNEFDDLLNLDFREYLQSNRPFAGVFSPEEELLKIRGLSRDTKKTAIEDFRDKFTRQKEALAHCRNFVERSIEFDNDVPKEQLMGWVEKFGKFYGFSHIQRNISEQLIDGYYANRKRALEIRRQFPNDIDLVNEVTNLKFDNPSEFEIEIGSMYVILTTTAINTSRIFKNNYMAVNNTNIGGFATIGEGDDPVCYIVINKEFKPEGNRSQKNILVHEIEHQKNRMFRDLFEDGFLDSREAADNLFQMYEEEKVRDTKDELLKAYLRIERQSALECAKDEIIAMKKDEVGDIYESLFFKDGSEYDYLFNVRDLQPNSENIYAYRAIMEKICVEEYDKMLRDSIRSFDDLVEKGGFTITDAIALLSDKSLPEWPTNVRRLLIEKEKRQVKSGNKSVSSERRVKLKPAKH